jgi:hypothetical protein
MLRSFIAASIFAISHCQDTCVNRPGAACGAKVPDDSLNDDGVSLLQTRIQVTDNTNETPFYGHHGAQRPLQMHDKEGENQVHGNPATETVGNIVEKVESAVFGKGQGASAKNAPVPPPSVTLQCVLNLTMQYFILYTLLQVLRTANQFCANAVLGWQKILESGCTTVTYAPALCCLFLGCRMRAIQLTQGKTDQYELPQPWVQNAMYTCAYAVLGQVILVLLVPLFTGEASVTTDADGNLDTSNMVGGGIAVLVLTGLRYLVMLSLYGGFATVCVGIHLMEGPEEIWGKGGAPEVSPAVACTINLTTQFFIVYLLVALAKTAVDISGPSKFLTKLQGLLSLAKYTQNFVPMLSILFIGARMRALQMDPKFGAPQWWAQYCFYGCTYSVLFQTALLILMPFCTKCECKQGAVEGDCVFVMENQLIGLLMTIFRYVAMLALYGGFSAVCVSVYLIEHPTDPMLTPPISSAMQCVMNLTVQYFGVYLMLFLLISIKQFSNARTGLIDTLIYTFEGAQKTVMFAPMLAVLFIGCRMRALQLILGDNETGVIPPGAGPQTWAQDAMFLATWSLHVQLIMTVLVPLITGAAKPEMDESGNPKAPQGSGKVIGIVFDVIRYLCLISMYGGSVTIMVACYYMTPDTLPPNDAGPLIPGLDVPQPPSAPTPGQPAPELPDIPGLR